MTTGQLALLAVAGAMSVALAAFALVAPSAALSRLETVLRSGGQGPRKSKTLNSAAAADRIRADFNAVVGKRLDRSERGVQLADRLSQAGLLVHPAEWLAISAGVAVVVGGLVMLRFGQLVAFPVGAALGYGGAQMFLRFRASSRRKAFEAQLSPALIAIGGALKAGYSFVQALDLVRKNSPDPMGIELQRVVREYQLGVTVPEALAGMVRRTDSDDLALVHTAVQIHAGSGGNLGQVIDRIEFTIRERIRIKGEIKTLTSQARVSGWILMALPFALGGLLTVIAPTYFTPMFSTLVGEIMLGACLFMMFCGYLIIRKITSIKV